MAPVKDKGLVYSLGAICTVILLIIVSLVVSPPLIAEDTAQQVSTVDSRVGDANMDQMVGKWEGRFVNLGTTYFGVMEVSYDLSGQWLRLQINTWTDSSMTTPGYVATVYVRPENHSTTYKAYLVDNLGSGQVGHSEVTHGVWQWVWEYDDGTREVGTMVTSAPGRLTYESRINDSAGMPLAAVEMDFTRVYETAKLGR